MRIKRALILAALGLLITGLLAVSIYWYLVEKPEETNQSTVLLDQGIALFKQRKYAQALQELEKIPDDAITDWRVPYYRGSTHMMLKHYDPAVASLQQALAVNSQEPAILYALGVAYFKQGNLKLAKGYFASVLEINPADEHAKGLMDIMAKLQRQSGKPAPASDKNKD